MTVRTLMALLDTQDPEAVVCLPGAPEAPREVAEALRATGGFEGAEGVRYGSYVLLTAAGGDSE